MIDSQFQKVILAFPEERFVFECLRDFANNAFLNYSAAAEVVGELIEDGFISWEVNRCDGKSHRYWLSDKGVLIWRCLRQIEEILDS